MDTQMIRQTARAWLDAHVEEMIADLQAFTRIRSVSRADLARPGAPFGPECREMLDFALNRAREMGFDTEDHDGYCGSAISGDGKDALGIVAHIDVVPEGEQWIYPPYGATRVGIFSLAAAPTTTKTPPCWACT